MSYINKTIVDLRREACANSERVSQALFGTKVKVHFSKGEWSEVKTPDAYRGFVEDRYLSQTHPSKGKQWKVKDAIVLVRRLNDDAILGRLAFDTRFFAWLRGGKLVLMSPSGEAGYIPRGTADIATATVDLAGLVQLARAFVGIPYLWGGVSPFGFDCSGFVQRLFHYCFNRWLPRDTVDQRRVGTPVELAALKRGDLCFFPGHVALYVGDGEIIHPNRQHNSVSLDRLLEPKDAYCRGLLRDFQGARCTGFVSSG